jgi:hypothetical protein
MDLLSSSVVTVGKIFSSVCGKSLKKFIMNWEKLKKKKRNILENFIII